VTKAEAVARMERYELAYMTLERGVQKHRLGRDGLFLSPEDERLYAALVRAQKGLAT
jgi:hypothetical protein